MPENLSRSEFLYRIKVSFLWWNEDSLVEPKLFQSYLTEKAIKSLLKNDFIELINKSNVKKSLPLILD